MSNPLWFKDAIIYELHVKTFQDSNADGIGDFRGLIQRLDYFAQLGVTAIWLLPFYPSPLRDDGYDIADYYTVNPSYGTIDDFREFLDEAHRRGLRVITELVLNHTSDANPWFQRARRAPAGSPERDFYVWTDNPKTYKEARIIFKDFETSNWTWDPVAKSYFWHRFYSHQPDLNFENPLVAEELFKVIDYWLEMGVDGLRLDAVPYLYEREGTNCENLPETHAFLQRLRSHIDTKFEDRMLLAEANQWPEDAAAYFGKGDECHMEFHFPLMPRMFMALQMEDRFPIIDILDQTPPIPTNCQWAIFLRNHDELTLEMVTDEERDYMYRVYAHDPRARINLGIRRRLAPLLGNNRRKIELINSLLFSLPGTPVIYYGDEIGMGDNFYLGDRNGVRTPMQWSADRNAGFSKANPQQLFLPTIIDPEYHYESINVENQQGNLSSLYWWMRRLLNVRQRSPAFSRGTLEFLHPGNAKVLVYLRRHEEEVILALANLSRFSQCVEVDLTAYAGLVPVEMFGQTKFPEIKQTPAVFTLGPHGFLWFALTKTAEPADGPRETPTLPLAPEWSGKLVQHLQRHVFPAYLTSCRWFGGKDRTMREISVVQQVPLDVDAPQLLLVDVAFTEGQSEQYLLPLAIIKGEEARRLSTEVPSSVVAAFQDGSILADAFHLTDFRAHLLRLIMENRRSSGPGSISGTRAVAADAEIISKALAQNRLASVEQSNSSVLYGDTWFLKFFRKFEHGPHPDVEITRFLSETSRFRNVPTYAGSLNLASPAGQGVVGMLLSYTQNQGDGWAYTLDALARFYDRVLEARAAPGSTDESQLIGGIYPERARQLGEITAELHVALASNTEHPDFAPEPFSPHYQRSLYQGMRGQAARILRVLREKLPELPSQVQPDAEWLLTREADLFAAFARLLDHNIDALKIRIHGDYHLGQVLNTGNDFVIIDFEGEPRAALGERRLKRSPLRDVGGMLRSFDYAAAVSLQQEREDDARAIEPWAYRWVDEMSCHFTRAYLQRAKTGGFLPANTADVRLLLETMLLNKAIYEIGYELSFRPDFVSIPLRAVVRLLNREASGVAEWVG